MLKTFRTLRKLKLPKKPFSLQNITENLKKNQQFSLKNPSNFEIPYELNYERTYTQSQLKNSINLCTIKSISKVLTISVFIKCGSSNEKEKHSGTAHFLEHMHFKGTNKRTKKQLELEIEDNGGSLNAYTTREYTSYIINFPENKLTWAIELLSDILTNSIYSEELIEQEKDTINTELLECLKEETESISEFGHECSFRENSIGRPILGRRRNIDSVNRDMVKDFHDLNYTGENLFFLISGNVEHEAFEKGLEKYFGGLPERKRVDDLEIRRNLEKPVFCREAMVIESPPGNLRMGFYWEASDWFDKDYIPMMLLQRMLGDYVKDNTFIKSDNCSKNLINKILRRDFIHRIDTSFIPYLKTGIFGTYFETDSDKGIETYDFFKNFINEYSNNLEAKDLEKAKNFILPELFQIENGTDLTQDFGPYILHINRILTKIEFSKRVEMIDINTIKDVLDKWFTGKGFSLTVWGSLEDAEKVALHHSEKKNIIYDKTE